MLVKAIILAMLAAVLIALGSAVFAMIGPRRDHKRMARALTWRISLSVLLLVLLLAGFASGVLQPHQAIPPRLTLHNQ